MEERLVTLWRSRVWQDSYIIYLHYITEKTLHSGVYYTPPFSDLSLHLAEYIISRVIALPSVKYSGRVETDVLGGARRVASQV